MDAEFPLDALERGYKSLHVSGRPIDSITDKEKFLEFFSRFGEVDEAFFDEHLHFVRRQPVWEEEPTIDRGQDIFVMRYPRYLPPYTHSHHWIEVYYVAEGAMVQVIEDAEVALRAGDLVIISPGIQHSFSIMNDAGVAFLIGIRRSTFMSAFAPLLRVDDVLSNFFTRALYNNIESIPYMLFRTDRDPAVENIIEWMLREKASGLPLTGTFLNLLFELLGVQLVRKYNDHIFLCEGGQPHRGTGEAPIARILNHIDRHFDTVTLEEVASVFNYSKAHLSRIIKDATGKTFAEIRTSIKVQNAVYMLTRQPSMTIGAICRAVGYADVSSFYKAFKSATGKTPMEYRR